MNNFFSLGRTDQGPPCINYSIKFILTKNIIFPVIHKTQLFGCGFYKQLTLRSDSFLFQLNTFSNAAENEIINYVVHCPKPTRETNVDSPFYGRK